MGVGAVPLIGLDLMRLIAVGPGPQWVCSSQGSPYRADDFEVVKRLLLMVVMSLVMSACFSDPARPITSDDWSPYPREVDGLEVPAWVVDDRLLIETSGGSREFVAGVNLGPTIPGHFPGEQAIRREDFKRWFPMMSDLGLRAVRVYTIMPPSFYEELRDFNLAHPEDPLYLVHGVWIPEQRFYETQDLFDTQLREEMATEIERAVAVVHGDVTLPDRPGHAWGEYSADVSPWLLSWALGVEWDPEATYASDAANEDVEPFRGEYVQATEDASPTEAWLAEMLDHLASEQVFYGRSVPLTFVNWPTTDPLAHPDEPLDKEDMVSVDANHVEATSSWPAGLYASYHAYPYYPDFQRYEDGITGFRHEGREDNYAGYLTKLRRHHEGMPVVITEFGVPSAMAHAHFGPQGRDQGNHSEQQQMAINAELLDVISDVGMSGGFVFEWTDEWFKFTWNTIDYELPWQRRALWKNAWTNEAHFGLIAVEPGHESLAIIDGDGGEWENNGSQVIFESRDAIREVRAHRDESYLYLRIVTDDAEAWRDEAVTIGLDVLPGNGGGLPGLHGVAALSDYAVTLGPGEGGQIWVRASNDPYAIRYGLVREYFEVDPADLAEGSGVWHPRRLIVNRPLRIPSTGEERPVEVMGPGLLRFGTSDPASSGFDSRTTWAADGKVIELRLPYQAIGFADPSSRLAYEIGRDGTINTVPVDRVGMTVVLVDQIAETAGYTWPNWQRPAWHERPKAGLGTLAEVLQRLNMLDGSATPTQE